MLHSPFPTQKSAIAHQILNQAWPFYFLYGMPPAPVDAPSSGDGDGPHWADDIAPGAFVDWLNPDGRWVTATVTEVSPTCTEVCVQEDGQVRDDAKHVCVGCAPVCMVREDA